MILRLIIDDKYSTSLNVDLFLNENNHSLYDFLMHNFPNLSNEQLIDFLKDIEISCFDKKIQLPELSISIDEIINRDFFDNDINKLLKRFLSVKSNNHDDSINSNFTLNDILNVDLIDFSKEKGIGSQYVKTLIRLKEMYSLKDDVISGSHDVDVDVVCLNENELEICFINHAFLNNDERKLLKRISQIDVVADINTILNLDGYELSKDPGFGKKYRETLLCLQNRLKESINEMRADNEYVGLISKIDPNANLQKISDCLLVDIDNFLDSLSEDKLNIFQKRWGFIEEKCTLEKVAEEYGITRERIRQIESHLNSLLIDSIRYKKTLISNKINGFVNDSIFEEMHDLWSCFSEQNDFISFLSFISDDQRLINYFNVEIPRGIINPLFEKYGNVTYDQIHDYVVENYDFINEAFTVKDLVRKLIDKSSIFIDNNNKVHPCLLTRPEAAAYVLTEHPNGLPWKDIYALINKMNCCSIKINENRLSNSSVDNSEHIYLYGKGIYRHVSFSEINNISHDLIFSELLNFYEKSNREQFHLNEAHNSSSLLRSFNYYDVRYIVRQFGYEYGFYFHGKSQLDTVSVEKDFNVVPQKQVVLEALTKSNEPLTKYQIANLLKSNSTAHATLYIDELVDEGKIVQIEYMLYTTTDKAYKDIDLASYGEFVNQLLVSYLVPLELSMIRLFSNNNFNVAYSRGFYLSLVKHLSKKYGWNRSGTLFSDKKIKYKNISDVVCSLYNNDLSISENIVLIQNEILADRTIIDNAIRTTKVHLRTNSIGS